MEKNFILIQNKMLFLNIYLLVMQKYTFILNFMITNVKLTFLILNRNIKIVGS